MGAGDWMLVYAEREVQPVLAAAPVLDRDAEHGYAIMTHVAAFSGVRMEPGTLYGALSRLERRGWVRPLATAGRRRTYEITATWPGRAGHGDAAGRARRPRPAGSGRRA